MKRILIIFTLLVSVTTLIKAQGGGGGRGAQGTPEERAQRSLGLLPASLELSADQKTKIAALFVAQAKSQDDLRATANGDIQSMLPKMTALTADTDAKILALLAGNQKTQYEAYIRARPAGGRGGQGGAPGGRGGAPQGGAGAWDGGGVFPGGGTFVPRSG